MTLAIENHDRFNSTTLVEILERIDSDRVGICLDTVNSFGALEGPEVVLENLGIATLQAEALSIVGADAGAFEIIEPVGEFEIGPDPSDQVTVIIRFHPSAPGRYEDATLSIQTDGGDMMIPLRGEDLPLAGIDYDWNIYL